MKTCVPYVSQKAVAKATPQLLSLTLAQPSGLLCLPWNWLFVAVCVATRMGRMVHGWLKHTKKAKLSSWRCGLSAAAQKLTKRPSFPAGVSSQGGDRPGRGPIRLLHSHGPVLCFCVWCLVWLSHACVLVNPSKHTPAV